MMPRCPKKHYGIIGSSYGQGSGNARPVHSPDPATSGVRPSLKRRHPRLQAQHKGKTKGGAGNGKQVGRARFKNKASFGSKRTAPPRGPRWLGPVLLGDHAGDGKQVSTNHKAVAKPSISPNLLVEGFRIIPSPQSGGHWAGSSPPDKCTRPCQSTMIPSVAGTPSINAIPASGPGTKAAVARSAKVADGNHRDTDHWSAGHRLGSGCGGSAAHPG